MRIAVFLGSSLGRADKYTAATAALGRCLAEAGAGVVYGGGRVGLMGVLADAALAAGGEVIGVIPAAMMTAEVAHHGITRLEVVDSMHARKLRMAELADGFAALPGGLGTLEELVEQMTWAQLGRHKKPILVANINGFWDPLLGLIAHMRALALVPSPAQGVNLLVADRIEDILPKLREAARAVVAAEQKMAVPADRM